MQVQSFKIVVKPTEGENEIVDEEPKSLGQILEKCKGTESVVFAMQTLNLGPNPGSSNSSCESSDLTKRSDEGGKVKHYEISVAVIWFQN